MRQLVLLALLLLPPPLGRRAFPWAPPASCPWTPGLAAKGGAWWAWGGRGGGRREGPRLKRRERDTVTKSKHGHTISPRSQEELKRHWGKGGPVWESTNEKCTIEKGKKNCENISATCGALDRGHLLFSVFLWRIPRSISARTHIFPISPPPPFSLFFFRLPKRERKRSEMDQFRPPPPLRSLPRGILVWIRGRGGARHHWNSITVNSDARGGRKRKRRKEEKTKTRLWSSFDSYKAGREGKMDSSGWFGPSNAKKSTVRGNCAKSPEKSRFAKYRVGLYGETSWFFILLYILYSSWSAWIKNK